MTFVSAELAKKFPQRSEWRYRVWKLPEHFREELPKQPTDQHTNLRSTRELSGTLVDSLEDVGITPELFLAILQQQYDEIIHSDVEELFAGDTTEDVHVRITRVHNTVVEISRSERFRPQTQPSDVEMQLKQGPITVKMFYVEKGEAVVGLPREVITAGEIYTAGDVVHEVRLKEGSLMIIRAPQAWFLKTASDDFTYLYISLPPHSSAGDVKVV